MRNLTDALHRQLGLNSETNLLHPEVARQLQIEPTFLTALEEVLAAPKQQVQAQELAELAATALIERVFSINQFIQVSRADRESLISIYLTTWQKILETRDIENNLRDFHYPLLAEWIGKLYPGSFKAALASHSKIGKVVCQSYSVELQIDLLNLEITSLKQPVMDIGCGKEALLVEYLRGKGIEAFGLDRSLHEKKDYLIEGDWLNHAFEGNRWGTVLSHMALTNHFAYAKKFDSDRALRYMTKYGEVLNSLQLKGSFVYAPGAIALELTVDRNKFSVERFSIENGYGMTRVLKFAP
jgi:hypothetical protein